jgi:hypothetical protein
MLIHLLVLYLLVVKTNTSILLRYEKELLVSPADPCNFFLCWNSPTIKYIH